MVDYGAVTNVVNADYMRMNDDGTPLACLKYFIIIICRVAFSTYGRSNFACNK